MSDENAPVRKFNWAAVGKWVIIIYIIGAIITFLFTGLLFTLTTTSGFSALLLAIVSALLWPLAILGLFGR